MTIFKTFLKIMNKNKTTIILYTVMLVVFGGLMIKNQDTSFDFEATKPEILVINYDSDNVITNNFLDYLDDNCVLSDLDVNDENAIKDALFYQSISYMVTIPSNYGNDFINGLNPEIIVNTATSSSGYYANNIVNRYLKVANVFQKTTNTDEELINNVNEELDIGTKVTVNNKLNTNGLNKVTRYFNFLSYSLLAGAIFVVCMVMSCFQKLNVKKRILISSTNYKEFNRKLFISNIVFMLAMWLMYFLLGVLLCGKVMFSISGLIYGLNSLTFSICTLAVGFLIMSLNKNKDSINGIINVIALGSSFLCGAFVPLDWLPSGVVSFAHILPTYWYILTNESLISLEINQFSDLYPIFINMGVVLLMTAGILIINNFISKKKRIIN